MIDYAGLALVITAIAGIIKVWYDVDQVHKIVNSRMTDVLAEVKRLRELVNESRRTQEPVPTKQPRTNEPPNDSTSQLR